MKKLLLLISLMLMSFVGYSQYPIKTIFKGDSVIILTIEQSDKINATIEKNSKRVKDLNIRTKELEQEILYLNQVVNDQKIYIDSLSNILTSYLNKETEETSVIDTLWKWALGPSLIYTEYPDDSTVYVMDLSHYYMTTDDFGIIMVKMSAREYKKYQDFVTTYGMDEKAFWEFRNGMRIKKLPSEEMEKKRVWKFKNDWNKYEKVDKE